MMNLWKKVRFVHRNDLLEIHSTSQWSMDLRYNYFIGKFCYARSFNLKFNNSKLFVSQIDEEQMTKILSMIDSGKAEGAKLVSGGDRVGSKGFFIAPTVFADVHDGMKIAREEVNI